MDEARGMIRLVVIGSLALSASSVCGLEPAYERAPISYSKTAADTAVTRLADRMVAGESILDGKTDREVLEQLLALLEVPVASQVLVYSKTSAQNSRISPERPRAIYFSDNAYIGWVQGGDIETMTFDPKIGAVFHRVSLKQTQPGDSPRVIRDQSCLSCHASSANHNVPGGLVRSVYASESGQPLFQAGTFFTGPDSPLAERWGGWYVTGSAGDQTHLGNGIAYEGEDDEVTLEKIAEGTISDLNEFIRCEAYLGGGSSDIVALMILEHQIAVHNALARGAMATRQTLYRHREMRKAFGEKLDGPLSETNQGIIDSQADKIVAALLFADEFEMTDDGVDGSIEFQNAFQQNARKSEDHRSLKDLRLYERLFKYRCSYMIYSEAFRQLPIELKTLVKSKIDVALEEGAGSGDYPHLTSGERRQIANILAETHPEWQK